MNIDIKILDHGKGLELPSYATPGSAGLDLRAAVESAVPLRQGARVLVPTGISISLPNGYNAEIRPRSGLALRNGITVLNSPGTVDCDYRGELKVLLINLGEEDFLIDRGLRIAQMVIQKYEMISWNVCDSLESTLRGRGGYGSTGLK